MIRRATALVLVALVGAAAGCGGGSSEPRLSAKQYRARLAMITRREEVVRTSVENTLRSSTTVRQVRNALSRYAANEESLGDTVDRLRPPKDADKANDQLAKGAHQLADDIRSVVGSLRSVRLRDEAITMLQRQLGSSQGAEDMAAASVELRRLGYVRDL